MSQALQDRNLYYQFFWGFGTSATPLQHVLTLAPPRSWVTPDVVFELWMFRSTMEGPIELGHCFPRDQKWGKSERCAGAYCISNLYVWLGQTEMSLFFDDAMGCSAMQLNWPSGCSNHTLCVRKMHWNVFYVLFLTNPVVTKELVNFILKTSLKYEFQNGKKWTAGWPQSQKLKIE